MQTPLPGNPVRGSVSGRPLMAALDLFGRKWSLRIIWELREGAVGFRPLQQRCDGMSSSVLRQRLTELVDARLVYQLPDSSYALTPLGQRAYQALTPLTRWSEEWSEELQMPAAESTTREGLPSLRQPGGALAATKAQSAVRAGIADRSPASATSPTDPAGLLLGIRSQAGSDRP